VIREIERPSVFVGTVICPHCREDNPGNFRVCWNCGEAI
jgi:hypothetical protein